MAQFDSKTFNPEVFGRYVERIPNLTRNELLKSRALVRRDDLKALFAPQTGAFKGTLPYFGKIGKSTQNYDGQTDITANGSETYTQSYIVVGRADAWTEKDFSDDITGGVDFMDNVAQQLGIYWDEVDTNTLTKILVGIFGMANCPDFVNNHTYNISGKSGDEAKFGVTTLNTAVQRALGDNKAKFALAIMHSMISTNLENQQLINFLKYTDKDGVQRDLSIGTLNGRIVLIDDGVPHYDAITTAEVKGTYTLVISTAFAKDEKVTIDGVEYKCVEGTPGENEFKGADKNAQATSLVSALNRNLLDFIATAASGTITFTQRVGGVGAKPTASTTATTGAIGSVTNGTAGVAEVKETVYTTYVFGEGAFEYCDVGAKVPYEMARDAAKNGGETTLYGRKRKVFAPKGISFVGNPATSSPTDAELSDGANWDIVNNGKTGADKKYIDHRAIAICRIISKG